MGQRQFVHGAIFVYGAEGAWQEPGVCACRHDGALVQIRGIDILHPPGARIKL
jgi:hypothetical protein